MKKRESLKRRRPFRTPLPRVLIVCEGTKTEPKYFSAFRRTYRRAVEIELRPGGVPKTLVERAVQMKKETNSAARAAKDENRRYDHVWCVFDVDDHPNVPEAKQQARDNKIDVAISNPCFELWALLHFEDHRAEISRVRVREMCRTHMPGYEKELPTDALQLRYVTAVTRARDLENWQKEQGRDGTPNPSTGVYKLTELIVNQ